MRILLTGAAGTIGQAVCPGLVELGHEVLGIDLVEKPEWFTGTWFTADCRRADAVEEIFTVAEIEGTVDAVVHLAGRPDEASLPEELDSHVVVTAVLTDAMVRHGVRRMFYASSNHAVGLVPAGSELTVDVLPRPDTYYGVAKVATEALLRLVVDRHGLEVVAARIGSFQPRPQSRRQLATWLSPGDATRLIAAAVTAPTVGFALVHGISANTRAWWDLEPGRALGYHPEDDAEEFAADIEATAETDRDRAEQAVVGGPQALPDYHRPAL